MSIEEEIYAELVKRFGVGEICIKKHGKRPSKTWLEFIKLALDIEAGDLFTVCNISATGFSTYFDREFSHIKEAKCKRQWRPFLLSLLELKKCSKCGSVKPYELFGSHASELDGHTCECLDCSSNIRQTDDYKLRRQASVKKNKEVISAIGKKYYQENKEDILLRNKHYRDSNKEKIAITKKEYYEENKEEILEKSRISSKKYYIANKETLRIKHKEHYQNNKYMYIAKDAKRRAAKIQATPKWADLEKIKEKYRTCPEGCHVDHIIPLQNDLVCGLHCEFNLQHLSAHENLSKGNKYEP